MPARYKKPQLVLFAPPMGPPAPPPLIVGRQRELTAAMNHYEAVKGRHIHVLLLTGDPGIGKTCLLDEVATRTAQDGAAVLRGSASEAAGMPPFLPFLEAMGRYVRTARQDQLRSQVAEVPQMLVSLLPELDVYFNDLRTSPPLPPEQARFRLYEAISTFLEAISASHALVLVLDDLHWADSASLDLLCYLAHHQLSSHLLILGAYRESEVDRNPAFAHTLTELARLRVLATMVVSPLSVAEIGMLALGRYGGSLSSEANALLHAHSEGNPFFAEELLDGWIESGAIKQVHQQWVAVAPLAQTLPPTIVGALRQRFERLAPAVIDHLRIAAIIGRSFDPALLALVEEQEIEAVEECLLISARARLIRTDEQGRFLFCHDKIRECLYSEVSTSRRQRLHERIGLVLEAFYGQEPAMSMRQLADLAFHFAHSGDRERGVRYSLRAATQALQSAAAEEAMTHYCTALDLLGPGDNRQGDILLDLGKAALWAGKEQEAELAYRAAQRWLLEAHEQASGTCAARAAHGLGLALWRQEKRQEASAALEYALAFFRNDQCVDRVKILVDLSQLLMFYKERHDEGMSYARQALKMARDLGETELEMTARRIIIRNPSLQGTDLSSAALSLEQILARTEVRGNLEGAAECCFNLAVYYYWMAEIRRSFEVSLHRIALIERCRQPYQLRTAHTWPVLLLASQGKWTQAQKEIERARSVVEHLTSPMPYALLRQFQGFLAYQQENYIVAERELEAALTLAGENLKNGLSEMMHFLGLLGLVQALRGKHAEAFASIEQLEHMLELLSDGLLAAAPIRMCLALASIAMNDHERARSLYTHLLAFRGQHYWFLVDRVLGLISTLCGEWETAAMYLAAAEATARHEGLRPELARTLLGQAEVALGQGTKESAQCAIDLLNRALALFEDLGMANSVHSVRHRLLTLTRSPHGTARLSPLPAKLTRREAAVLKLVTYGKSNSQIAQELVISEKTVINHLTHIFNKTNSENRTAATAFAIRNGLV